MRIFISYSEFDKEIAEIIANQLLKDGHKVFYDRLSLKLGENLIRKIDEGLSDANVILVIYSRKSSSSKWAQRELESVILNDLSKEKKRIIPISIDGALPPGYLMNYQMVDLSTKNIEDGVRHLSSILSNENRHRKPKKEDYRKRNEICIDELKKSLKSGNLTIVCGAGVSIGANVPSWNNLLLRLLGSMMFKLSKNGSFSLKSFSVKDIQRRLGSSSLVIGKYLKANLGKDFLHELREALYSKDPKTCDLIDSIVEVSRPQRDGKPLDSIITFNFDALLEENLKRNNITFKAIYAEGIRNSSDELPIYHVHGYLPRKGKLTKENDVVLSEDAYHTQFIDPFSWSNLIQLNKLSQNNCLLVGISLTDPNMRRLLDVSKRKEPSEKLNHFIIKKIPNLDSNVIRNDELMMFLEEQDANDLGLNILWVEEIDEIPNLIRKLIK